MPERRALEQALPFSAWVRSLGGAPVRTGPWTHVAPLTAPVEGRAFVQPDLPETRRPVPRGVVRCGCRRPWGVATVAVLQGTAVIERLEAAGVAVAQ